MLVSCSSFPTSESLLVEVDNDSQMDSLLHVVSRRPFSYYSFPLDSDTDIIIVAVLVTNLWNVMREGCLQFRVLPSCVRQKLKHEPIEASGVRICVQKCFSILSVTVMRFDSESESVHHDQ